MFSRASWLDLGARCTGWGLIFTPLAHGLWTTGRKRFSSLGCRKCWQGSVPQYRARREGKGTCSAASQWTQPEQGRTQARRPTKVSLTTGNIITEVIYSGSEGPGRTLLWWRKHGRFVWGQQGHKVREVEFIVNLFVSLHHPSHW